MHYDPPPPPPPCTSLNQHLRKLFCQYDSKLSLKLEKSSITAASSSVEALLTMGLRLCLYQPDHLGAYEGSFYCTALFYVPRDKLTIGFKGYNLKFEELHPRPLLSIRQNEGLVYACCKINPYIWWPQSFKNKVFSFLMRCTFSVSLACVV